MSERAKKVKSIIKNPPPKSTFGTDPNDPWSTKYGISESPTLNKYLLARGFNPKTVTKDIKIAHSKSNAFLNWQRSHMNESGEKTPVEHLPADKNKTPSDAMMSYANKNKSKHIPSSEIKNPPGTLRREEIELDEVSLGDYKTKAAQQSKELKKHTKGEYGDIAKRMLARREKGLSMAGKRDSTMHPKGSQTPQLTPEDVGDAKAAVNADGLPNPHLEPATGMRKMSKGAKLLLDIKRKKMNEDLYDHEKDDKSIKGSTYGKKPKMDTADKEKGTNDGQEKPKAAATLTGGTTLTGQKRDTVEIDPVMRVRPGQPDPTKSKDKDKEKDGKKKE